MTTDDLPFKVEYARSGRAHCQGCHNPIPYDVLRIARVLESILYEGIQLNWFHPTCFFKYHRPTSEGDFLGFKDIRHADQQWIRRAIVKHNIQVEFVAKNNRLEVRMTKFALRDFGIKYAISGRAVCRHCIQPIHKYEIRVKKVAYDTDIGMRYGGEALWHHLDCFAANSSLLGWYGSGKQLPGFKDMTRKDQQKVVELLPDVYVKQEGQTKKTKLLAKKPTKAEPDAQNETYFTNRDWSQHNLTKHEMLVILKANDQELPRAIHSILNAMAELLTFGALQKCPTCGGQLKFLAITYKCTGFLSDGVHCKHSTREPTRKPCIIPKSIKHSFLTNQHFEVRTRMYTTRQNRWRIKAELKSEAKRNTGCNRPYNKHS